MTVREDATVYADTTVNVVAGKDVNVFNTADVWAKGNGITTGDTLKFEAKNGDIVVKSDAAAGKEAVVMAGVVVDENTYSGDNQMTLTAKKNVKVQNRGTVAASGVMNVTATDDDIIVANNARVAAGGDLTGTAGTNVGLSDNAVVATKGALGLTGTAGYFKAEDNAKALAKGDVTISAATTANVDDNAVVGAGELATDLSDVSITATSGKISIDGVVQARRDIAITATAGDVEIFDDTATVGKVLVEDADAPATTTPYTDTTKGLVKAQAGKVDISAGAGGSTASVTVREDATVQAAQNVSVVAGKDITVRDTADVLAGNKGAAAEAIKLDAVNGAISVDGTVVATADDVVLEAMGAVLVSDVAATAPLAGDTVNGLVQAKGGNVTVESETAGVTVQDNTRVLAGVNDDATFTVATAGKTVTLRAAQTSGAGSISVSDNAVVAGSQDVVANAQGAIDVLGNAQVLAKANDAKLTADTGAISIDGVVEAGNDVAVTATLGDVTVEDNVAGTDTTKGLVKADAGKVEISAGAAGTTASVTVREDATVQAAQNVSVVAGKDITVRDTADVLAGNKGAAAEAIKLDAVNGAISVDGTVVATADDVKLNAGTSVTVKDDNGAADGQKGVVQATAGAVDIAAVNGITITDTADVDAGTTVDIKSTAAGAVTVDTTGHVVAANGNATIDNRNGNVTIQNATVQANGTGAIDIDANGNVVVEKGTQNATVTGATGVTIDTDAASGGNITVGNAAAGDGTTITATTGALVANADGSITQQSDTKLDAVAANVDMDAKTGITVADNAVVEAATTVDMNNTGAGNIAITSAGAATDATKSAVTAENGAVTIDADNGAVTIANGKVEAVNAGTAGNVDIDATAGVAVNAAAQVKAADNMTVDTTGGDIATAAGTTVSAGGTLAASATDTTAGNGNINLNGAVTVVGTTDFKAAGDIAATDGVNNDFGGAVTATGATGAGSSAGAVTLQDKNAIDIARVEATGAVDIDAAGTGLAAGTTAVTVSGPITTTAADAGAVKAIDIAAANGNVAVNSTVNATAGSTAVDAAAGNVTATAKITGNVDADVTAAGSVTATDVEATTGNATVAAAAGSVTANDITGGNNASVTANGNATVNDVTATAGNAAVTATTGNAVANDVSAGNNASVTANGNATVNDVTATAGNASITATTGSIVANNVEATAGDADVKAAVNVTTGTIGAGGTATAEATTGNANVSFDANNVNVAAGGNAVVDVLAGKYNTTGDLTVDSNTAVPGKSSVVVGGNLDIDVAGKIGTTGGAEIKAGGNLDVKASTASSPLNVEVGGTTIGVDLANQEAVAINDHDRQYTVNGNNSHTAIFIDGRIAGGDSRYVSVLNSFEAEAARGVVVGPLPVPNVFSMFTASLYTTDLPFGAPANLGQSYMSDESGTIDTGDAFPDADKKLSIPGLPANSTIFFGTQKEDEKKGDMAML